MPTNHRFGPLAILTRSDYNSWDGMDDRANPVRRSTTASPRDPPIPIRETCEPPRAFDVNSSAAGPASNRRGRTRHTAVREEPRDEVDWTCIGNVALRCRVFESGTHRHRVAFHLLRRGANDASDSDTGFRLNDLARRFLGLCEYGRAHVHVHPHEWRIGGLPRCHRWLWDSPAVRIDWAKQTNLTAINETGCSEDDHLIERGFSATKEIYVQYHVRYQAHFQFDWSVARAAGTAGECTGATKKLFLIIPVSGARLQLFSENHHIVLYTENHLIGTAKPGIQNNGPEVTPEMLGDGRWHQITIHAKMSSSPNVTDGFLYGWIDGEMKWFNPAYATGATGGWYDFQTPTVFNNGSPIAQSEWLDDLKVWGADRAHSRRGTEAPSIRPLGDCRGGHLGPIGELGIDVRRRSRLTSGPLGVIDEEVVH